MRLDSGHSLLEIDVQDAMVSMYPDLAIIVRDRERLDGKELDLFFPELNSAIEVNGDYYHNDFDGSTVREDAVKAKLDLCERKGIKMGIVWESDWNGSNAAVIAAIRDLIGYGVVDPILLKTSTCGSYVDYERIRQKF